MNNICINVSNESYLNAVVEIHMEAFPGFFLTLLGRSFLIELYRGFIVSESAVLLVNLDSSGNVVGFIAGTTNPELFFSNLRKKRFLYFLLASMKALFFKPIVVSKKLFSAIFYSGDNTSNIEGGALLSSIGVRPQKSGGGVGSMLLKNFEDYLSTKGSPRVYLMTDKEGNDHVIEFYKRHGYEVESIIRKSDERIMCRFVKELQGLKV